MKKVVIKILIACVIISGVGVGGYYGYNKFFGSKPATSKNAYYGVSARKMNMSVNIQGTGTAYAAVTKDIMPNNNGTLKDLNVKVGDSVNAGAKLFTSDSDDLRKSVTSAQSNLDKQNLSLVSDQNADKVDTNRVAMDQLSVKDAQNQLNYAYGQLNKMTVTSPIGGVVTAVNNANGDSIQANKAVLSIADPSSMKIKVSVDELDIEKVKQGQTANIIFDAIKGKTYEGNVESIAQVGTTSNNVTTYDVVVSIKDPTGIKIGMNANVSIQIANKDNALVVPSEALIDRNGQEFVMVPSSTNSSTNSNSGNNATAGQNQNIEGQPDGQNGQGNAQNGQGNRNRQGGFSGSTYSGGRLVPIKIGLQNENFVEVTEGLTEGQQVLIILPQASTTTTTNNNRSGGFGGGMGGFGGGMGGNRNSGGSGNNAKKGN